MKRKEVQDDTVYALCVRDGDMEKAFDRVYAIIYGQAQDITQMRLLLKRRRRKEKELEFI